MTDDNDGCCNKAKRFVGVIKRYMDARSRWIAAGSPERSDADVARILDICQGCPQYRTISRRLNLGQCRLCKCALNLGRQLNKIRWATEGCPANPPKWEADVVLEGVQCLDDLPAEEKERQMTRRERRREKRRQRQEEAAAEAVRAARDEAAEEGGGRRRRRRRRRWAPPLAELPPNNDPLLVTDRFKNPIGHCLRNLWSPCAGFLVCGGPSLNEFPLDRLRERGICSLGVNNAAGRAPVKAFTCSDPPEKFHHGIFLDPGILKLVPKSKLGKRVRAKKPDGTFEFTTLNLQMCPNVFGYARNSVWDPAEFLTSDHATWGNGKDGVARNGRPKILFTFFLGLRLMHYLGVRRVYLLGVDFSMRPEQRYAWETVRTEDAVNGNNDHYRTAAPMLEELKPYLDAAGFQVFNCNPKSALTVFPHVPFADALEDCRGHVPAEPWQPTDLEGWYDKDSGTAQRVREQAAAR